MRFVKTIENIWKIEDLRKRLITTLFFIAIYRFGSFVVLPGVDPVQLQALQSNASSGLLGLLDMFSGGAFANASIFALGLMALLDMFSGGAFANASVFALGIMPYISASIVIQLLTIAVPYFQKMQREGESGRRKMNQYTRYLTVLILIVQGPAYIYGALGNAVPGGFWDWVLPTTIILASGSMFVLWLGERITDKGIGNGISFIILIGIIARLPLALIGEFVSRLKDSGGGLIVFMLEIVFLLFIIAAAIMLVQGARKVPVQYAKRIVGNKQYGGVRQYIPLKVNAANVMPIIFAQAIMFIPITVANFTAKEGGGFLSALMDHTSVWYNLIFALMIIAFTYFFV